MMILGLLSYQFLSVNKFYLSINLVEYISLIIILAISSFCLQMLCSRCTKRMQITTRQLDLESLNIQGDVRRIDCMENHFITVTLNNEIIDINNMCRDRLENTWREVQTNRDKLLFYVLSQIIYPEFDTPRPEKFESLYAVADVLDIILLRWQEGIAIGFYTIRPAGTGIFSMKEKYAMPMIDTAYIRSEYRNRGFGTEILFDVIARFPNKDIGFSKPISSGMLKILKAFLTNHKIYRLRFWETNYNIDGSQQLIWCQLKKTVL